MTCLCQNCPVKSRTQVSPVKVSLYGVNRFKTTTAINRSCCLRVFNRVDLKYKF